MAGRVFAWPITGCLAQLVERRLYTANVGGSSPSAPTIQSNSYARVAVLADLFGAPYGKAADGYRCARLPAGGQCPLGFRGVRHGELPEGRRPPTQEFAGAAVDSVIGGVPMLHP